MLNKLKNSALWAAILTLIYLIAKNWIGCEIPAWNDISEQLVAILSILWSV